MNCNINELGLSLQNRSVVHLISMHLLFPMCLSFSLNTASSCDGLSRCPPTAPAPVGNGSTLPGVEEDIDVCAILLPTAAPFSFLIELSAGTRNQFKIKNVLR